MAITAARRDVERQRALDRNWPRHMPQDVLGARLRALAEDQRALEVGEDESALFVVRQCLIDVSAAAADLADELPAPTAV